MSALTKLESHFGVPLPRGYVDWNSKHYLDYHNHADKYLWVNEAEWIPPEDIPEYDLGRVNIIRSLIPFAVSGRGDHWCWNTQVCNSSAEYEILFCLHDEDLAEAYAPTFPAWYYSNCLYYAAGTLDNSPESIDKARNNLRLWSQRLSEIYSGSWVDHLASLAEATPFEYKHPKLRADVVLFGFITAMDVERIVANEFGRRYLDEKVKWGEFA